MQAQAQANNVYMAERAAIFATMKAQRVRARPARPIVTPTWIMYPLQLHPEESIAKVEKAMPQVQLQISNMRRTETHLRLHHPPLVIEAPNPQPMTLTWPENVELGTHAMLAGRGYTFTGPQSQIVRFDESPHTLIAGITGSGKSVLAQGMALSLALHTSPTELRYMVVDLKRDDLVPLMQLPHTVQFAGAPDEATNAIAAVHAEMERRRDSYEHPVFRLVLWIDELSMLPDEAADMLKDITALGRSMQINVVAATQHPTAEVLGGSAGKINYTTRLVGLVADASAASTATGRTKTGAEMLPGKGSFIRVEGSKTIRFQSYFISYPDLRRMVTGVKRKWRGTAVAPLAQRVAAPVQASEVLAQSTSTDELLHDVFAAYHDGNGDLMRGGMMTAIRALYGDAAATGGRRHQEQRDEVLRRFDAWIASLPVEPSR